jgi:hypothetical protein
VFFYVLLPKKNVELFLLEFSFGFSPKCFYFSFGFDLK